MNFGDFLLYLVAVFAWVADRGLAFTGADGQESLLLAAPDSSEQALLVTGMGFYRALVDPAAPQLPRQRVVSSQLTGKPAQRHH